MQLLRQSTLPVVLAVTLGAAWACSSDSTPSPSSGSGSTASSGTVGSSGSTANSGSTASSGTVGSSGSTATSGTATSGAATSGDTTTSGSTATSGTTTGVDAGDDGGGDATTNMDTGAAPESGGGTPEGGSASDGGGATFTQVYQIIMTSCLPCHATGAGATMGMLNMSTQAMAYTNLVGKMAAGTACTGMGTRVIAGNAMTSLLINKVGPGTPRCGMHMPRGAGATPLSAMNVNIIRSWINAGALDN